MKKNTVQTQQEPMKLSALLQILQQVHTTLGDDAEIIGDISTCRSAMLYARWDITGQLRGVKLRLLPEEV